MGKPYILSQANKETREHESSWAFTFGQTVDICNSSLISFLRSETTIGLHYSKIPIRFLIRADACWTLYHLTELTYTAYNASSNVHKNY